MTETDRNKFADFTYPCHVNQPPVVKLDASTVVGATSRCFHMWLTFAYDLLFLTCGKKVLQCLLPLFLDGDLYKVKFLVWSVSSSWSSPCFWHFQRHFILNSSPFCHKITSFLWRRPFFFFPSTVHVSQLNSSNRKKKKTHLSIWCHIPEQIPRPELTIHNLKTVILYW